MGWGGDSATTDLPPSQVYTRTPQLSAACHRQRQRRLLPHRGGPRKGGADPRHVISCHAAECESVSMEIARKFATIGTGNGITRPCRDVGWQMTGVFGGRPFTAIGRVGVRVTLTTRREAA